MARPLPLATALFAAVTACAPPPRSATPPAPDEDAAPVTLNALEEPDPDAGELLIQFGADSAPKKVTVTALGCVGASSPSGSCPRSSG